MCPRGIPPLRRSSRPTTYVGILSVACDRMEPPPDPTAGTGQRPPADKTLSREVYGHHTGFESGGCNASTGGRPAVPPEPLSVRRCSGGDSMPATVVVGAQFGDEGKGKIVDYLADRADVVVRFQGGANAGHTVQVGDQLYAFHLLPSGVLRKRSMNVIGNGVVIDPAQLLKEIEETRAHGHSVENLRISDRAHVVMPYHKIIDGLEEKLKGGLGAGTTLRGIGPAFEDKVGRFGIRMCDLIDPELLRAKLRTIVPIKQRLIDAFGGSEQLDADALFTEHEAYGKRLAPFVIDTAAWLDAALKRRKRILFEGAQGTHLCIDHGVYPFGTSSHYVAGAASVR